MNVLTTELLQKNRQRTKHAYSQSDYAYQEIANRLFERLDYVLIKPEKILVYGWQTDYEIQHLKNRYPNADILWHSDILSLSAVSDDTIQLVISNCALDWENDPKVVLQAFHRVLADNGLLHFTTLGPDTGLELRESFAAVDAYPHVHTFTDMHHIGDCLKRLAYSDPVVDMEMLTLAFDDLSDLFFDLKNTASTNIHQDKRRGLMSRSQWQKMLSHYETIKVEDYYPFTLEIIYGHAWKTQKKEFAVPIDKILKRQDC